MLPLSNLFRFEGKPSMSHLISRCPFHRGCSICIVKNMMRKGKKLRIRNIREANICS